MKVSRPLGLLARRVLSFFGLFTLLATTARATWSIVVVDRSTGEVCVATATCLTMYIHKIVPVVVVGKGVAAAQANGDGSGVNRVLIRDGFRGGDDPAQILADLAATDGSHQGRQYGIVSLYDGAPITFTGSQAMIAKHGVSGEVGSIRYAIQGNVLAGEAVVTECERTLLNTEGDLVTRVMAAMQTARIWGGDGRCSCSLMHPTQCGCPPPDFDRSAYTACIMLARQGDPDGWCNSHGCATGDYYLTFGIKGNHNQDDPVITLARMVRQWRKDLSGFPDHILTDVRPQATRLPGDGVTTTEVVVSLADIDGVELTHGGQAIVVTDVSSGGPFAIAGPVVDNGDGTHTFQVTATATTGVAEFQLEVTEAAKTIRLFPNLEIVVDSPAELHVGHSEISAAEGAEVPFLIDTGALGASRPYLLLLSASGTQPGTSHGWMTIPLNYDRYLQWSLLAPTVPFWTGNHGVLDSLGKGQSLLTVEPGAFAGHVGGRFDFCVLQPRYVTAPVGFEVLP